MSTRFLVKRRITGGAGPGTPTVVEGELAYNEDGNAVVNLGDSQSKDDLWVGGAGNAAKALVSNTRQVELSGIQNNVSGRKAFKILAFGGVAGDGSDDVPFPLARGVSGQALIMNAAGSGLEFGDVGVVTRTASIPNVGGGSVDENFNVVSDWSVIIPSNPTGPLVIGANELWFFYDEESAQMYFWRGTPGLYGRNAGGTSAVPADFSVFGSSVNYATRSEVEAGVEPAKGVAPDVIKSSMLVASNAGIDIPQTMNNSIAFSGVSSGPNAVAVTFINKARLDATSLIVDNGSEIFMVANSFIHGGSDGARGKMNFLALSPNATGLPPECSIKGDGVSHNQIDDCIFDAGIF